MNNEDGQYEQLDMLTGYVYAGVKPCGCIVSVIVDSSDHAQAVAAMVNQLRQYGLTIQYLLHTEVQLRICRCDQK